MELNYSLIGVKIKKMRMAKQITQNKLSEMCDISPQHLSQIESGKTKLSLQTLVSICNALEVGADRILCDVLSADTRDMEEDIADVFRGCSPDERYLMLAAAESIKHAVKLKRIKLTHE